MILCPSCGNENIEGVDSCEECGLSLTDLSFKMPASPVEWGLVQDRIGVLEPRKPYTVGPDAPVAEVLTSMVDERIGCVMIVDGEKLLGIFTERDALMRVNAGVAEFADRPIRSVMTPNPVTLDLHDKIAYALHKMHVGGYRHLPILDDDRLVGVSSIRDILNYLAERMVAPA